MLKIVVRYQLNIALDALISKTLAMSLRPLADQALGLLEDKVLRLGEWYESYWFASAACE